MSGFLFNLTNIIDNSSPIDRFANYSLKPLHGLMELTGKKVKVYEVDSRFYSVSEKHTSSEKNSAKTIWKVIHISLQILLFIPSTLIGVCLKGLAKLDRTTNKKYQILLNSGMFNQSITKLESKALIRHDRSIALNDVLLNHIIAYLSPRNILSLKVLSKAWWLALSTPCSAALTYRDTLMGMSKIEDPKNYSFWSLGLDCQTYANKYGYSYNVIDLFDGIENFLKIPFIEINVEKADQIFGKIEEFAHSTEFQTLPSILRLRTNSTENSLIKETILIKYTMFIPKVNQENEVWQDYFLLYPHSERMFNNNRFVDWRINDARCYMSSFRKAKNYSEPSLSLQPIFSEEHVWGYHLELVKKLFQNLPIGVWRNPNISYLFNSLYVTQIIHPYYPYIDQSLLKWESFTTGTIFKDLPVMLGNLSLQDMESLLQEQFCTIYFTDPFISSKILKRQRFTFWAFDT